MTALPISQTTSPAAPARELLERRYSDRAAISYATARGIDDDAVDAGTWPPDADLEAISALARRGLAELAKVDLT